MFRWIPGARSSYGRSRSVGYRWRMNGGGGAGGPRRADAAREDGGTVQEQRERWERKRARTMRELLETEQRYVEELELITKFYDDVFRARCGHLKIAQKGICGTIPDMLKVHRTFLSSLARGSFGSGFENLSQSLDLYKKHAERIQPTRQLLETQKKKNKLFARFNKLQESRPEFEGRSLEQLLELPLKRLRGYKHYLRDLAENNLPRNPDTKRLTGSLSAVCDVCRYVDDIAMNQENLRQLQRVQKLLKGRTLRVLGAGRWYIREGWLSLVPQSGDEVKPRMLFLFSDVLAVTSPCHPMHPTNAHKFSCRAVYPLMECRVERVLGHTQSQGGLISLSFEKEKILLMSTDQQDINDWYECLVTAVRKIHSNSEDCQNRQHEAAPEHHRLTKHRTLKRTWVEELGEGSAASGSSISAGQEGTSSKRMKAPDQGSAVPCSQTEAPQDGGGWRCAIL
ncbi:rho guanine nucleotide exchange factor 39 [Spea bombifrons]|uniref:rho guanine nucleotide exchange factor 39 n=1 Tax=Spea bombifrons TaxID=233779 RepID=UPI00234AED56|nr:rho guanine nucleotide exchange factor 39 [Spea bombifrons]